MFVLWFIASLWLLEPSVATPVSANPTAVHTWLPADQRTQSSNPAHFVTWRGQVYFTAFDDAGLTLYHTDGVNVAPVSLTTASFATSQRSIVPDPVVIGDALYFQTFTPNAGVVWRLDEVGERPRRVLTHGPGADVHFNTHPKGAFIAVLEQDKGRFFLDQGDGAKLLRTMDQLGFRFASATVGDRVWFVTGDSRGRVTLWRTAGSTGVIAVADLVAPNVAGLSGEQATGDFQLFGLRGQGVLLWGVRRAGEVQLRVSQFDADTGAREDHRVTGSSFRGAFVAADKLFFQIFREGLFRFDGVSVRDMASINTRFKDLDPENLLPTPDGFYLTRRRATPSGVDDELYHYTDQTARLTLRHRFANAHMQIFRFHPDGRLFFVVNPRGTTPSALWSDDRAADQTIRLSNEQQAFSLNFGFLDAGVVTEAAHPRLGREPHLFQNGEYTLIGDINRQPNPLPHGIQSVVRNDTLYLLEADRLLRVQDGVVEVEAGWDTFTAGGLSTSQDRLFVMDQDRRQVFEVGPDGPVLLMTAPDQVSHFTRVFSYGPDILLAAYTPEQDEGTPTSPLENTLIYRREDGELTVINTGRPVANGRFALDELGGHPLFTQRDESHTRIMLFQDGATHTLWRGSAGQQILADLYLLGTYGDRAYARTQRPDFLSGPFHLPTADPYSLFLDLNSTGSDVLFNQSVLGHRVLADHVLLTTPEAFIAYGADGLPIPLLDGYHNFISQPPKAEEAVVAGGVPSALYRSDGTPEGTYRLADVPRTKAYLGRMGSCVYVYSGAETPLLMVQRELGGRPVPVRNAPALDQNLPEVVATRDALYLLDVTRLGVRTLWRLRDASAQRLTLPVLGRLDASPHDMVALTHGVYFQSPNPDGPGLVLHRIQDQAGTPDEEPDPPVEDPPPIQPGSGELIDAPATMNANKIGIARIPLLPDGADIQWRIEGGRFIQTPQRDALVFKTGGGPQTILHLTLTLPDGGVQVDRHEITVLEP